MTITTTIDASPVATLARRFTASADVVDSRLPALRLGVNEFLFINADAPYTFTIEYEDGTTANGEAFGLSDIHESFEIYDTLEVYTP